MGVKTNVKDIAVVIDPLSFIAEIEIVSGNVAQTFNQDTKEYEADRRVLPCVLMPSVSASDNDGLVNGKQPITGCEWYEGAPKQDGSNRIKDDANFAISAEGKPKWSLSVKKNVEPNVPLDIHAVFTITDTRRNTEVKIERSVSLYTALYDSKVYSMRIIDQPASWVIDPLRITPDASGKWMHKVTAQLYTGKEPVEDAHAAYWWQIREGNSWRYFTQDEKDICVAGENTKQLSFDARFFRGATFRCRSAYYTGTRPQHPTNETLVAQTTFKVEFPKTLRATIRQTAGARVDAALHTTVGFECVLADNKAIVPDSLNELFDITWMAVSGKPGIAHKAFGKGRRISFSPSSLGFDKNYSMAVYAEVKMHAVRVPVTNNNVILTSGGKVVTATKYE